MTIRIPASSSKIDKKRVSALLSYALLYDAVDDAPEVLQADGKAGWMRWTAGYSIHSPLD